MTSPGGNGGWARREGTPGPLGATWIAAEQAMNFALYSRHATGVSLLLYARADPVRPLLTHRLDPRANKTGPLWHCRLSQAQLAGAELYAYRVEGPAEPEAGHRFDPAKVLLDPFARGVFFPPAHDRDACAAPGPSDGKAPLGLLPRSSGVEHRGEVPPPRHSHETVVYELHVRGFTAHPSSGVAPEKRGTFAGLVEKIPYLADLGVNVVELMPVHQYDPREGNYWGYMTLNFFSPHAGYAAGEPFAEFRGMVQAFHAAGIEVWLDVVYNHTCEEDEAGPTYSFRGIDNHSYYLLDDDRSRYLDFSGCGNTLRCAHPAVRSLVLDSLRFWTAEMRVDGFRFDLASILARRADGSLYEEDPPLIAEISRLAHDAGVRVVAEAWDIDSYLLGRGFPGLSWRQWNGKFRDDVRSFVRGDRGKVGALMQRLYGSDDLFPDTLHEACRPFQSVNFVTAHDGFCLYDLVSYERKRNQANGHANRDGANDNRSWNCGHEGDAGAPPEVLLLRRRQVKNFFGLLLLANGTPQFCAGDEFLRTQGGNNNPYNQDNATTWVDWRKLRANRDVHRFVKLMIAFRKAHPSIARSGFWRGDVRWYGVGAHTDLGPDSRTLAYFLGGEALGDGDLYVMINGWREALGFRVQEGGARQWHRVVDTSLPSPHDIAEPGRETPLAGLDYSVAARSLVVLYRAPSARPAAPAPRADTCA